MTGNYGCEAAEGGTEATLRLRAFDDIAVGQRLVGDAGRRAGMTLAEIYEAAAAAAELLEAAFHLTGRPVLIKVRDACGRRHLGIELALELPRAARLRPLCALSSRFGRLRAGRTLHGRFKLTSVRWKRRPTRGVARRPQNGLDPGAPLPVDGHAASRESTDAQPQGDAVLGAREKRARRAP